MAEQSNSGRNILITGIVLGIAAAGLGAYTMSSTKAEKPAADLSATTAKVEDFVKAAEQVRDKIAANHTVEDIAPKGAEVAGKPRFTPLFFAPELWQVAVDTPGGKKNVVMDIHNPASQQIHQGVDNSWFISHGLQEALGRSNGLDMDSDGDGFSNREEFEAQTNPADIKSYPALITPGKPNPKLEVVEIKNSNFVIQVDSSFSYGATPADVRIKVLKKAEDRDALVNGTYKPGDSFGPAKDSKRFTIVEFVREKYSDNTGYETEENAVKLRDNETAGLEKEFVVRAGAVRNSDKARGTRNEKGRRVHDSSAVLRVTAGPAAGKEEGTITVAEHATFKLPGTDITCTLESIDDAQTVNVRPEGAESPVNIKKAAASAEQAPAPKEKKDPK